MRNTLQILLLSILLAVACVGCMMVPNGDGTSSFKIGITPETHSIVSEAGEAATGILGGLSALFPALAPIAAAAGVGTLTWKKMQKSVTQNKEPLKMLVKVLEGLKTAEDPAAWKAVREKIAQEYPSLDIDATIRNIKAEMARSGELKTS